MPLLLRHHSGARTIASHPEADIIKAFVSKLTH